MRIVKRMVALLVAIALLAGVVKLGILSGTDATFVVWFGIASAIAAPIGLSLLGYVFSGSDEDLIQRLAKVPQIEDLVAEAESQEERVRILEAEQARLAEVVRLESRRQAAKDRKESLERDAQRILDELDNLGAELREIDGEVGDSLVRDEIARLRERVSARRGGDVVLRIGSRVYRIDRDIIKALPLGYGNFLLAWARVLERRSSRK